MKTLLTKSISIDGQTHRLTATDDSDRMTMRVSVLITESGGKRVLDCFVGRYLPPTYAMTVCSERPFYADAEGVINMASWLLDLLPAEHKPGVVSLCGTVLRAVVCG
ncbi:MAG TPA: hypothetical protein VIV60_20315 [Polyangiaceae bacterium]